MSIAYCSIENMNAYFFMKYLQGYLFEFFFEVTMEWKHVNNLQTGPPSTKECVVNEVKIELKKN